MGCIKTFAPLNALRALETAGRLGSFTKAAADLGVSHSAISPHVRGLEARLNVHLPHQEQRRRAY
ncbi:LysR family transcriptional regulator [Ruegeria atlantica]|uniref:LysR family transcriptional regulator n=1 Tax=Ruegeria atlantica TaxID=81569 RepID=UPI0009E94A0A|nr:LysR family transcriptional regulator [Ruegeria atlantica]